jgi:hypothetical protein
VEPVPVPMREDTMREGAMRGDRGE